MSSSDGGALPDFSVEETSARVVNVLLEELRAALPRMMERPDGDLRDGDPPGAELRSAGLAGCTLG